MAKFDDIIGLSFLFFLLLIFFRWHRHNRRRVCSNWHQGFRFLNLLFLLLLLFLILLLLFLLLLFIIFLLYHSIRSGWGSRRSSQGTTKRCHEVHVIHVFVNIIIFLRSLRLLNCW